MFRSRDPLQELLETICGHVYFQPPENLQLKYPAIIYYLSKLDKIYADNSSYLSFTAYDIVVVDRSPDSVIADAISKLPMCRFNRSYVSQNLNHFSFTLYY